MRNIKWITFIAIAAILTIVAGCSGNETSSKENGEDAAGETYEWKLGWNSGLDGTARGEAAKAFAEYVEDNSDGRISIEFFPNETYGTAQEMIEAVQIGALDMQIAGSNMMANIVPQYAALSLPFLTKGTDEAYAVLDGEIGDHLKELGEEEGFKVLGDVDLGFAQITNNVRPIHTPEDLAGVKMRSPNDKSLIETFKAFDSSVSTMAYTEIYNGLSQGVIDGQFNPLLHIFDQNMDEVQDYLAITNHTYYYAYFIMNNDLFNNLDEELQQVVLEGGQKATEAARQFGAENEEKYLEMAQDAFKEITEPELAPFQEAVQPVYETMADVMGEDIINDMQSFLEEYRANK
ncbi:TRAP transporter substrate-binding protein [Aquibacillus albus]|uniref:C4-dicarboxylate-binding protein DctP n=1 Tax=Aquibacillus albus TaxID=1168171 RepID=A0ABS2MWT6_9BACI|nr:TRAP transporter substrate-binding protein [Aquibacillus albus]MBM7570350.1 C4-dicarboxylate-binding protein DctP [Aquibacillus albus]